MYAGDNKVVYFWFTGRKSGVRAGRLLIRVLNLVEKRHRCRILGGWWRTFHNEDADALTRLEEKEAAELIVKKASTKLWRTQSASACASCRGQIRRTGTS